jgi:hypothetical protein
MWLSSLAILGQQTVTKISTQYLMVKRSFKVPLQVFSLLNVST